MLEELEETRDPFENFIEFLAGGYWRQPEAIHLSLGWLFSLALLVHLLRRTSLPLPVRLAIAYFGLVLYTNAAFDFFGLKLNDVFGVTAVLALPFSRAAPLLTWGRASPVVRALGAVFLLGLIHNLAVAVVYPDLNPDTRTLLIRAAVNLKILVLALNLMIVGQALRSSGTLDVLVKVVVAAGTFGLLMYVLQVLLFLLGTIPFGTYLDAGFIGVPSFGAVSAERGHFGKFSAPLFPFFLYALVTYRWRWPFALLLLVSSGNFSASGMAFFTIFLALTAWQFADRLKSGKALAGALLVGMLIGTNVFLFSEVFAGVLDKIYQFAIVGDESSGGGRSVGIFLQYIDRYPFGIGYGGSSLRNAPTLPEINAAHYAFVSQYSIFSIPVFAVFFSLLWRTVREANRPTNHRDLSKAMLVGVLGSAFIFATDILWFVPTCWLAYEIVWRKDVSAGKRRRSAKRTSPMAPSIGLEPQSLAASPLMPRV